MTSNNSNIRVGLDLGTNSIGWAVIREQDGKLQEILGLGSRIIPMGDEKKEFETGAKITKNAGRRMKRGMRRQNQRYKLRRERLKLALAKMGHLPAWLNTEVGTEQPLLSNIELYGLRAKAAAMPLTEDEFNAYFGIILYHLNQRRGYKDIGELMDEVNGEDEKDEKKSRNAVSMEDVTIASATVEDDKGKSTIYRIVLADGRVGTTVYKTIADSVDKVIELEISAKTLKDGSVSIGFKIPEKTDWKKKMESLDQEIGSSGLTPGQYFYNQLKENPLFRVKDRVVLRDRYKDEFNRIWEMQASAHSQLRDADNVLRNALLTAELGKVRVVNEGQRPLWAKKSLKELVRDHIIYYQRPLKSQAQSIAQCGFESDKKVCPKSSPAFEEWRIWQQVNNIRYADALGRDHDLTEEERERMYDRLQEQKELTPEAIAKLLKLPAGSTLSQKKSIAGHIVKHRLRSALSDFEGEADRIISSPTLLHLCWHILYSIAERDYRMKALTTQVALSTEAAAALADMRFEKKHGSLSARAIGKVLPLLRCGRHFTTADIKPAVAERIERVITGEYDEQLSDATREAMHHINSIEDCRGLKNWLALSLVYGDHRRALGDKTYSSPDEVQPLERGSLRNPVVEQVVNETLQVMADLWKQYGRPDAVRVELPREFKMNADERKNMTNNINKRDKERRAVEERLKSEFGRPRPSRKDVEKLLLWEEQGHLCIYSGTTIQKSQLFNGETDIDHILPQARFYDDSYSNRVLSLRSENKAKSNATAYEYMKGKGEAAFDNYSNRVTALFKAKGISFKKWKYLLAEEIPKDFLNRQLNDTRYISAKMTAELERFCPKAVHTTIGGVTDEIKGMWGLHEVFKEVMMPRFRRMESIAGRPLIQRIDNQGQQHWQIEGFEKRLDHRHHALDALTVALTTQSHIQHLNNLNQLNEQQKEEQLKKKKMRRFDLPHPDLRHMVKDAMESIIVSHKSRKRLLTKSVNEYMAFDRKKQQHVTRRQGNVYSVRGPLHNEQPLGEVCQYGKLPIAKVLDRLIDAPHLLAADLPKEQRLFGVEWQRQRVAEYMARFGNDPAKARKALSKNPIYNMKGERLNEVTVIRRLYTTMRSIGPAFTQFDKMLDRGLAKELKTFFEANGSDPKKAFTADKMVEFNRTRTQPVRTVKCVMDNTEIGEAMGRELMPTADNRKRYFEKGDNFCIAVYDALDDSGKRETEVIPFFDAVVLTVNGQPIVPEREGFKSHTLWRFEPIYVMRPGEESATINWKDRKAVAERIYRVVKFSGKQYYFLPSTISDMVSIETAEKEFGTQNCTEFVDMDEPRSKIIQRCIKVQMDRLGNVKPIS